jgi:hypothetical protein
LAATININGAIAVIDGYRWSGRGPGGAALADTLNAFLDPDGPPAYDPNPDATMAKEMAKRFKGKVIKVDETEIATDGVN